MVLVDEVYVTNGTSRPRRSSNVDDDNETDEMAQRKLLSITTSKMQMILWCSCAARGTANARRTYVRHRSANRSQYVCVWCVKIANNFIFVRSDFFVPLSLALSGRIGSFCSQPRCWFVFAFRRRLPRMRYANGTFPFVFTVFVCVTSALPERDERNKQKQKIEKDERGSDESRVSFLLVAAAAAAARIAFAHVHE